MEYPTPEIAKKMNKIVKVYLFSGINCSTPESFNNSKKKPVIEVEGYIVPQLNNLLVIPNSSYSFWVEGYHSKYYAFTKEEALEKIDLLRKGEIESLENEIKILENKMTKLQQHLNGLKNIIV